MTLITYLAGDRRLRAPNAQAAMPTAVGDAVGAQLVNGENQVRAAPSAEPGELSLALDYAAHRAQRGAREVQLGASGAELDLNAVLIRA